jgi:hypothetical protein
MGLSFKQNGKCDRAHGLHKDKREEWWCYHVLEKGKRKPVEISIILLGLEVKRIVDLHAETEFFCSTLQKTVIYSNTRNHSAGGAVPC